MSQEKIAEATNAMLKNVLTDAVAYRTHNKDADALLQSGIYQVTYGMNNLPAGAYYYGALVVFNAGLFVAQVYFPHYKTKGHDLYTRVWYNDKWKPWQCYDSLEGVDPVPATT